MEWSPNQHILQDFLQTTNTQGTTVLSEQSHVYSDTSLGTESPWRSDTVSSLHNKVCAIEFSCTRTGTNPVAEEEKKWLEIGSDGVPGVWRQNQGIPKQNRDWSWLHKCEFYKLHYRFLELILRPPPILILPEFGPLSPVRMLGR